MNINEVVNTAPIEQFVKNIGVNKVFGTPTKEGDTTIIPVAQVEFAFGFGGGYGTGPNENDAAVEMVADSMDDASDENGRNGEGAGGGGGAGGRSTPRGYIHIGPEGVKYTPIMDELRVPIGGLLVGAWTVFWVATTIRAIAKAIVALRGKALIAKEGSE